MSTEPRAVITLLTDFGTSDYFVAAMKGVMLTINPSVSFVDITHEIPPQDIESAAFTLLTCYRDFPGGTIHLAVVDPGVGSARRPIVVRAGAQCFVGPDNGLFSYVYDREPAVEVFHITATEHFRQEPSTTFHGRDVFAPVAAGLSTGIDPQVFGRRIANPIRLAPLSPAADEAGKLRGRIIHIDHFGNCITNFSRAELPETNSVSLHVNGKVVKTFRQFFSDERGSQEELFAIWGSAGFLELAVNRGSAAEALSAKRGDEVIVSA